MHASQPTVSRIVVGLDPDGVAEHGVHAALELASILSAKLDVVHVVRPFAALADVRAFESAAAEEARLSAARTASLAYLESLCGKLALTAPKPRFDEVLTVVAGRPAQELARRARESGAELVVLGARHRRHGLTLGGTVREMLASSPCSVWVQSTPVRRICRVLAPVDLSVASERSAAVAIEFARDLGASVTLLHAFDSMPYVAAVSPDGWSLAPTFAVDEVRRELEREYHAFAAKLGWNGVPHDVVFEEREPCAAILARASEHDLVVLGTHGRGSALPSVLGGTAWTVLRSVEVPALAVRLADQLGAPRS